MFESEQDLVRCFVAQLLRSDSVAREGAWAQISSEFDYARGRTDVVALSLDGDLVAFEAKLSRWRTALHQAFRNTCFSDFSYVVLPLDVAKRAAQYEQEFAVRKVGLCGISHGEIHVLRDAPRTTPTEPWLAQRAVKQIRDMQCHVAA